MSENTNDIVYFELNNWFSGRDYPPEEPFISWLGSDLKQTLASNKWLKENKVCVVFSLVDMSFNYCVTARKDWVEKNCPKLLSDEEYEYSVHRVGPNGNEIVKYTKKYRDFLRFPNEDGDVKGKFGCKFAPYKEENFRINYLEEEEE